MKMRLGLIGILSLSLLACEEEAKKPVTALAPLVEEAAPTPAKVPSAPHLVITESGPQVRGMSASLTMPTGAPDTQGLGRLRTYLQEEADFFKDKEVKVVVDRKAKPEWVATFLDELAKHSPEKVLLATDTRSDFPKEMPFVPQAQLSSPAPCSLVGTITQDRGTAIWRLSGGTARKRGRGMGGPDLSMTAETIESMSGDCDSDLFFVGAVEGVEWGLVYDLAAAGLSHPKAGLKRAVIPLRSITAGNKVEL